MGYQHRRMRQLLWPLALPDLAEFLLTPLTAPAPTSGS